MIDIRDYDMAMLNRIRAFFSNTHWVQRPNISIKEIRDRKVLDGRDLEFPLLVVRRAQCPIINKEYNSWSRANTGNPYGANTKTSFDLKSIDRELYDKITSDGHIDGVAVVNSTYTLTYYIDVISLERDNFDTLVVELQENLLRFPYLSFDNIKSNGSIDKLVNGQACHVIFEEVEDTSDLENFDSGNSLYRSTITLTINAYIYRKYRVRTVEEAIITNALRDNDGSIIQQTTDDTVFSLDDQTSDDIIIETEDGESSVDDKTERP